MYSQKVARTFGLGDSCTAEHTHFLESDALTCKVKGERNCWNPSLIGEVLENSKTF